MVLLYWQEFPFTDAKNCASEVHRLCLSHNLIPALPKDVARFMLSINYLDISFNQLELLPEQVKSRRTPDSHMQSHGASGKRIYVCVHTELGCALVRFLPSCQRHGFDLSIAARRRGGPQLKQSGCLVSCDAMVP